MKMNYIFIFIFLAITANTAIAQKNKKRESSTKKPKEVKEADKLYFDNNNLDAAIKLYSKVANSKKENLYANYMSGKLYLLIDQKGFALPYLQTVFEQNNKYRADLIYLLADAYRHKYKFDKAIKFFEQYLEMLNMSQLVNIKGNIIPPDIVNKSIRECKFAKESVIKPKPYRLQNLGQKINSPYPDYSPNLNIDETTLVFTSRRPEGNLNKKIAPDGLPFEDIYISKLDANTNKWGTATNIGKHINTPMHDSNISISLIENILYTYIDVNNGDIFSTSIISENGDERQVKHLKYPINTDYKEDSFVVAPDGSFAILSSDRPSGLGGLDLYVLKKDGQDWSQIKNIGIDINTSYDEKSPFIHPNGTLYFASKGHQNMGGFDIFQSSFDPISKKWSKPRNMGYPINTPNDDVFFVVSLDGKTAYLSTVRDAGMGYSDIYLLEGLDKPQKTAPKVVDNTQKKTAPKVVDNTQKKTAPKVVDNTQKKTIPPKQNKRMPDINESILKDKNAKIVLRIILKDAESDISLPSDNVQLRHLETGNIQLAKTTDDPNLAVFIFNNDKKEEYIMTAQADDYTFRSFIVTVPKATTKQRIITQKVPLKKIVGGQKEILYNVYFETDSNVLQSSSYLILNNLRETLEKNNNINLEIIGHTDKKGSEKLNQILSENRAKSVVDYLIKQGIDNKRLTYTGLGSKDPLASNDDEEEGRELNRRVEFKIIAKK